jgi:hypothetical protein
MEYRILPFSWKKGQSIQTTEFEILKSATDYHMYILLWEFFQVVVKTSKLKKIPNYLRQGKLRKEH